MSEGSTFRTGSISASSRPLVVLILTEAALMFKAKLQYFALKDVLDQEPSNPCS